MIRDYKVEARKDISRRGIEIYIYKTFPDGKFSMVEMGDLTAKEQDEWRESHPIVVEYEVAQQIMDALWYVGLRPTEGSGSAGSLKATENHLKDMQSLSWRLLTMIEEKEHAK